MRRLALLVGIGTVLYGSLRIHHIQTVIDACGTTEQSNHLGGIGASSGCLNQVGLEYGYFAVVMAGILLIAFAAVLMHRNRRGRRSARAEGSRLSHTPELLLRSQPRPTGPPTGPWPARDASEPPTPDGGSVDLHQKSA